MTGDGKGFALLTGRRSSAVLAWGCPDASIFRRTEVDEQ